ncbi:MAG: ParB/RepB/Spo0J family partition protein [Propionibacteriaceae bacterium]|jgi:ParB family chromosome partitioning protein|nr:ParB/RepB/Spo0J family partition protein [Propionibacteriaceae bacterium]
MAAKKSSKHVGLGRGLGDLFERTDPDLPRNIALDTFTGEIIESAGAQLVDVEVERVQPNPKQPRQVFDQEELDELSESIKEVGVLQPIVVRQIEDGYELVMGERRLRAAQQAGLATIPAIIRATEDADMLRDALLENIHRASLNPLEEAAAYQQLLFDFGVTQDELAKRIKRSRPHISNTIRLLQLPPSVQRRVAAGLISAGHARALLTLDSPAAMEALAARIIAEGLSVRSTEEIAGMQKPRQSRTSSGKTQELSSRVVEIREAIAEHLETRVRITTGHWGHITIDFADVDDLERIADLMLETK